MIKIKVTFVITYFLIGFIWCQNIGAQSINNISQSKNKAIDSLKKKKMGEAGIVGIGAVIIINKKVVWTHGYGYADKENKIPFTSSTIMNIASVSKLLQDFV